MTVNRLFLRGIVASFFFCLTGSLAFGVPRTWVAGSSTTNTAPCSRSAPCMTFAFALGQTDAGGEIDVLDSGDFGGVTIGQSVSIVAQGVVAGIQAPGADAIFVGGSNVVVVLRGLTLDGVNGGVGAGVGIVFAGSGVLHVESCTIHNFANGILVVPTTSSHVLIKDTIVRNSVGSGIVFNPGGSATVTASLDNVRSENNGRSGVRAVDTSSDISVRNSVLAGNAESGFAADANSGHVVINIESSIASGNSLDGIEASSASSTINMSNVTVVGNTTGLKTTNGGQIVSFWNNKITDNTTNGLPTKTISQK
jgi:hypothetical protein